MATAQLDTLAPIRDKLLAGSRLDFDDGIALLECHDLLALGELADAVRQVRGGNDDVYYNVTERDTPIPPRRDWTRSSTERARPTPTASIT